MKTLFAWLFLTSLSMAAGVEADSRRGAALFEQQRCNMCHATSSQGGKTTAPDLEQRLDRSYTPAGIASLMWNHAPRMWAAQREA
jgi:cytochrome c2